MKIIHTIVKLLTSQTAVFVSLAAALAFIEPSAFKWVKGDTQTIILGLIMLTMGMTLSADDFRILLKRPFDIFLGAMAQYTIMPLLAWLIVKIFDLPLGVGIGLLLVGTCPGGVSSNIMSYLTKGDVAYSVGMTTASTLLSPAITPLLMLWLSGENVDVDAFGMFKSILYVTLLPVGIGTTLNILFGKKEFYKQAMRFMPALAVIALAMIVGGVTAWHGSHFFTSGLVIFCAIATHNALGYFGGYFTGSIFKMTIPQKRTLSIEVGCQNAGLATNLASTHFAAHPEAAVASAVACVYHSISGTILANIFYMISKKAPSASTSRR